MKDNHVLITGLGAISAAGINLADTLDSFECGKRNASPVSLFETALKYPVFEVKKVPEKFHLEGQRTLSLALAAVDEALKQACLEDDISKYRIGVCMGTTVASQLNDLDFYKSYRSIGSAPMTAVDRYLKGNLAEFILRRIKAKGPAFTIVNACSSGTDAIGVALSWLNNGLCDIAIAGGADELSRIPLCGFASLGIMNPDLCAPFDKSRKGLNLGEGAGVLVIETKDSTQKRGMQSDLYVTSYGSAADAYHLTAPHPEGIGLEAAINKALTDSGIGPEKVSFVNAHGTGTTDNDMVEGNTLKKIFGSQLKMLSTKGFTGHTLGAAGGLEAVFTAAGLRRGWIPASAGFENKDEAIALAPVAEKTIVDGRYAVSTSLAFGGNNAAIVLGRDLNT
ncbi:MAG: beta-ketoacyl-[acyl-carrier-protein] synthase family protein [Deltaproteobacteria bacterium]|nr:beta-ketoacyl-[acyl-carrier-protein] synthase family protein [Deltaproteobacteria bacterium]